MSDDGYVPLAQQFADDEWEEVLTRWVKQTEPRALALSLFWSQGSMSPEGLEAVYPEPHLSTGMLRCALLMLATRNADNPADGTRHLLMQWAQEKA